MKTKAKTTLITGANSGLGFETARQLLNRSNRVVISARSERKAETAVAALRKITGVEAEQVDYVIADFTEPATVEAAVVEIERRDLSLDGVVMNAGGVAKLENGTFPRTQSGLTTMFAMNVGGHVTLLSQLLDRHRLRPNAGIVFSSSEVCRGIPVMGAVPAQLPEHSGSLEDAIHSAIRGEHLEDKVDIFAEYGLAKLLGTAWMRHLAQTHGDHYRFYAISPGASVGTQGAKNMPLPMRLMMKYLMMPAFQLVGRAHGVKTGAARYIQGLEGEGVESGGFFASPYPHMSGPLVRQATEERLPMLEDPAFTTAVGRVLDTLVDRPVAAVTV